MSSNLKQKLQTSIWNSSPQCNIKVILKSTNHLSSLFRFKDVIPKELRSHLVYELSCSSCNATYYGKIKRHLNGRSGKHISVSPLTGNRVACKPSATSDHLLLHEHKNSSFNDFSILRCENNAFKLSLRESILIKRYSPELNKNVRSMLLLLFNQLLYNHQWNIDSLFHILQSYKQFLFHFIKEFVWSLLELLVESLQNSNKKIKFWNFY